MTDKVSAKAANNVGYVAPQTNTDAAKNTKGSKNVNVIPAKSDEYIETEHYLASCKDKCKDKELRKVFDKVDCIINQDGSVRFAFKEDVNVEDFKKAFGFKDGNLRTYLKKRHDEGIKNGTVHACYTNGATNDHEQRTDYMLGGIGSTINYTDGYSETRQYKGGWINRSKIIDYPDYTKMNLGPADNESLYTFGKSFFNYD